ncbi:DUF2188 domain-containing protein [Lagierella sp.]|uniref:DUF2188 domain-containing protein n=1 Tax=Lagierella sp. TaxID=2849657 RepID=UPI002601DBF5|nr:DUF2188 domain-containing protein [Lagierella sp.]
MVWTKKDYPDSFKNLEEKVRVKAIDIGNAMLKDGYDEGRVIPIAISKAKDWAENASPKEKKDTMKKDVTKHKKTNSNAGKLQDADVIVRYREEDKKWEVKTQGAKRADSLHDKKVDAEKRAKEIAEYRDGKVISHKKGE